MLRFLGFRALVHWGTAIGFLLFAVTGVAILFGSRAAAAHRPWRAGLLLNAPASWYNYVGPLFGVFVVLMFFAFLRDNVWRPIDAQWIRRAPAACSTAATCPGALQLRREDLVLVRRHLPSASPWRSPA